MENTPENNQENNQENSAPNEPNQPNDKVIGIPTDKYLKICYILVLLSSGFGILTSLLALTGAHIPGGGLIGLLGLVGIILAVLGWLVFSENFSALETSHFKFLSILTAAIIVISIALASFGSFLIMLISAVNFVCLFVGYKTWQDGQEATKDNLISGFKTLTSSIKK